MSRKNLKRKIIWRVQVVEIENHNELNTLYDIHFFSKETAYKQYIKFGIRYFDDEFVAVFIEPVEVF